MSWFQFSLTLVTSIECYSEDMWFIYALLSVVFAGLQAFLNKAAAEKRLDSYYLSSVSAVVAFGISFVLLLLTHKDLTAIPAIVYWLGLASGVLYLGRVLTQLEALRFVHTTIFFPLYKVIGPAIVAIIGIFFFKENLSVSEIAGIVLSCAVPLLLLNRAEHHRQKNLPLGLLLMLVSTTLAACLAAVNAYAVRPNESLVLPFMAVTYAFSALCGIALYAKRLPNKNLVGELKRHSNPVALRISFGIGVCQCLSFFALLLAFAEGSLSIAYTISAHYILIPIILSVWIYKEHWNSQKALALVVSICALVLLH